MTGETVITGTYAHLNFIKTRSVVQVIVEAPIENAKHITDVLGFPMPGAETPVAIARLKDKPIVPQERKQSLAQQAGILCSEGRFETFLKETHPHIGAEDSADAVRQICGVDSRAEFDTDAQAGQRWKSLKGHYDAWVATA